MVLRIVAILLLMAVNLQAFSQDTLKVMFYNILRFPETGAANRVDEFRTIFQYEKPDVLLVCELNSEAGADMILNQALNVFGTTHYDRATFEANSTGGDITNLVFYNSDKLGLVRENNLATNRRDIGIYLFYHKDPMLAVHQDTAYIDFWTTHLKAGSSSSDQNQRRTTALQFVQFVNILTPEPYRLFSGDFNMRSSNEEAWGIIAGNANQDFHDPIDELGTWHNNINFAELHTQSPRTTSFGEGANGGMDDRFDFILISDQIEADNGRVRYIPDTYRALGNDGNHYNTAINNGINLSAPDSVIQAIHDASDHLPVVLDLEIMPGVITNVQEINDKAAFELYPNPALEQLVVEGRFESDVQLIISNSLGEIVMTKLVSGGFSSLPVNIGHLNPGNYFLTLDNNEQRSTRRFVKLD
ncbi:MAG: T9SS type A sorting domain-containing protein [Bacteroidota bacterium]